MGAGALGPPESHWLCKHRPQAAQEQQSLRDLTYGSALGHSPGGDNPPTTIAEPEYPNRFMESTPKVLLGFFFNLSNQLTASLVTKMMVTNLDFCLSFAFGGQSGPDLGSENLVGKVFW
jgi:hypothetical protein